MRSISKASSTAALTALLGVGCTPFLDRCLMAAPSIPLVMVRLTCGKRLGIRFSRR